MPWGPDKQPWNKPNGWPAWKGQEPPWAGTVWVVGQAVTARLVVDVRSSEVELPPAPSLALAMGRRSRVPAPRPRSAGLSLSLQKAEAAARPRPGESRFLDGALVSLWSNWQLCMHWFRRPRGPPLPPGLVRVPSGTRPPVLPERLLEGVETRPGPVPRGPPGRGWARQRWTDRTPKQALFHSTAQPPPTPCLSFPTLSP